jgi:thiamine transport system permease protein
VRYSFPGKSLLLTLSTLPFVLPTVVVGAAFLALVGPNGLINEWLMAAFSLERPPLELQQTLALVLIAHVFYNYALALRMIAAFWITQSAQMEDAARLLGANSFQIWRRIWLPILRPAILAAATLIFVFTFTSFGVVLLLGGIRFATLEVQIYYQALSVFNLPVAAALSLLQIILMFAAMAFYARLQQRVTRSAFQYRQVARAPKTVPEYVFLIVNIGFMIVFLLMPLAALVVKSLWDGNQFTLSYYQALGVNERNSILYTAPVHAVWNSILYALVTTVLASILGLLSVYLLEARGTARKLINWIDPLLMLPLATSAVTLGFGFIITLNKPPLDLRSSAMIIPIAHTLVAVPFVIRNVLPVLRSIPENIQEAAAVHGASPFQRWMTIQLPLLARALVVGGIFSFTVSMGEFGASMFIARPDSTTIPLVIYRLLGQPGNEHYGQAMAMSVVLLLTCIISFAVMERVRSHTGEF